MEQKLKICIFLEKIKLINVGENPSVDVFIGQIDETADARISASVQNCQLDAVQHQRRAFVTLRNKFHVLKTSTTGTKNKSQYSRSQVWFHRKPWSKTDPAPDTLPDSALATKRIAGRRTVLQTPKRKYTKMFFFKR